MNFSEFNLLLQNHVAEMVKDVNNLFVVDIGDKDKFWNLYLDSFPKGTNKIYRKRREFDCSCCRHFVKSFGNIVSIKNSKITTVWDFETEDDTYQPVVNILSAYVKSFSVSDVFVSKINSFGTKVSYEKAESGIVTWEHFYVKLPEKFIFKGSDSEASKMGEFRDIRNVFKRSLEEISSDSVETILELISQGSLYKGEEWQAVLKQFQKLQKEYLNVSSKDSWAWEKSVEVGPVIGKIKNHSIGTLLVDVSSGTDLDDAVRKYESMVAPTNYKRPKAIFTKKMLEDAQRTVEELGFMDSLGRRYASLNDITVPNTLYVNRDIKKALGVSVFDDMKEAVSVNPKSFDKVEEVNIETFIKDILPTAKNLEVMFENKHFGNLVSLVAPKDKDSKTMFKWNNNFSWAYSGNITDSMKERVKAAGGKVDGVLRFSIQWNDDGDNDNDFDAYCREPSGNIIYFGHKVNYETSGTLDVDIRSPKVEIQNCVAVENITWSNRNRMQQGTYVFSVNNFNHRGGRKGFTAEIEFDGQLFSFTYDKELRQNETVQVAEVTFKNNEFKLIEKLPSTASSKEVWGIKSNVFTPVSICMYSPNYWDLQEGIGNKHYFFMLNGCKNTESPNGFFNEFLKEDLMKHKRVFEALGSKMKVEDSDNQLSGVGFSSTKRSSIICKVESSFIRTIKIIF